MADSTSYYDNLSDEDSAALEQVLSPATLAALGTGAGSDQEKIAAKRVDRVINGAPTLTSPVAIYRSYSGAEEIRNGGIIADRAFLTGSTKDPGNSGSVTLKIIVPAGTKALEITGDSGTAYVLARNTHMAVEPSKAGLVPAVVGDSKAINLTASAVRVPTPIVGMTILNQSNEEFYNHAHGKGGKFTSGGSSKGRGLGGLSGGSTHAPRNNDGAKRKLTKDQRSVLRFNRVNHALKIVAGVLTAATVVAYIHAAAKTTPSARSGVPQRQRAKSFYSRDFNKRTETGRPLSDANRRNESASQWYERTLREKPVIR